MRVSGITGIALAFAAGILAVEYSPLPVVILAACAAVVLGMAFLERRQRATAIALAMALVIGALRHSQDLQIAPHDVSRYAGHAVGFEGVVASDPEQNENRERLVVSARSVDLGTSRQRVSGSVMVTVYANATGEAPVLHYGDRVLIAASLYEPFEPSNPGVHSWKAYLARQGIYSCASVRSASQVKVLDSRGGNPLVGAALGFRHFIAREIGRIHPKAEASVIIGMVLGTYAYLPHDTFANFQRTGTLHLLAASGYNCYVLLAFAGPLLGLLHIMPQRRNLLVICLIVFYTLVAGAKPSLVRAAVMASLFLLAMPLRRVPDMRNILATAFFVILLVSPSDLFDVGFQLSFLAVWALVEVAPVIEPLTRRYGLALEPADRRRGVVRLWARTRAREVVAAGVGTTAIALVTAPVVAYYFNYVSLVSLPANVALASGVPLVFLDGLLSPLVSHVPLLGHLWGTAGSWLVGALLAVVNGLGELRWAATSVACPGVGIVAGYYLVLYAALSTMRHANASK